MHRRDLFRSTLAGLGGLALAPWTRAEEGNPPRSSKILVKVMQLPRSEKPSFTFSGLIAIDPKDNSWTQVAEAQFGQTRVSPDGHGLALSAISRQGSSLYIGDLDAEEPPHEVYKEDGWRVGLPLWAPDGKTLLLTLYSGARDAPQVKAVRLKPDGSVVGEQPLPPRAIVMDWSKDDRLLALVRGEPPRDPKTLQANQSLVLFRLDGTEVRRIQEGSAGTVARFSPDGTRILASS
ncbi:MAG TPA: hypothetical protein VFT74_06580, partial [Isosphaeraceae bacterium]|nr:hypothetical protein [Isosphaeraceae bacterium]